jgi:uncharacterized protein YodC (DUF2158 family)
MTEEFQVGDLVRMRSGGPVLTVTTVLADSEPPEVCVMWFESRGRPHFYYLKAIALEPAEPEASEQVFERGRR